MMGELEAGASRTIRKAVALYALDDVLPVLGVDRATDPECDENPFAIGNAPLSRDTEHQFRVARIAHQGEGGRWRIAVGSDPEAMTGLDDLAARAPHLDALTALVRRHLLAALVIGLPTSLPPTLLLTPPGTGKTWYLSKLGAMLGLPFRSYAMSMSTLGEGIQGAHPSWRNAHPGLVAETLLREGEANPLVFVDEFDNPTFSSANGDPWRPFYMLLDPSGSHRFTDEYLGFEMDASNVVWAMAANGIDGLPSPILDRLTIVEVPDMTRDQRAAVAASIYGEANGGRSGFFDTCLAGAVLDRLSELNPRSIRIVVEDAMSRAAAEGRRTVRPGDVVGRPAPAKARAGFM